MSSLYRIKPPILNVYKGLPLYTNTSPSNDYFKQFLADVEFETSSFGLTECNLVILLTCRVLFFNDQG